MSLKKIVCVVGTRPEAIKMAPVILRLQKEPWAKTIVLATAQHRELADEVFSVFGITPDIDLNLMQPGQTLSGLTARALTHLDETFRQIKPDAVLTQGDTTTVMAAAMTCFYHHIPMFHVEAGLRSFDMQNPFPEEFNRIVASRIAAVHYAPTLSSRQNLLNEGVRDDTILVTGNTVIDALQDVAGRNLPLPVNISQNRKLILVTVHRRENFGDPIQGICAAIHQLVSEEKNIEVLWPVHPNPNVTSVAHSVLGHLDRVHLVPPLSYGPFVSAMKHAHFILSDSGGVQEEAPALGRPVLVLRKETERPEAIEEGVVRLIGAEKDTILANARELLHDEAAYKAMARGISPYGDGQAAERITESLRRWAGISLVNGQTMPAIAQFRHAS